MSIVIAGATGFIGRELVEALVKEGRRVFALTRDPNRLPASWKGTVEGLAWNGRGSGSWRSALEGCEAVVNLAGENIGEGRWTAARKKRILDSRLESAHALVAAMRAASKRPKRFVSASAVGYYGDLPEGEADESAPAGRGFLADVCRQWEQAALEAETLGVPTAVARFGVVLSARGGALPRMALPFKLMAGGRAGSGRQWLSWVHRDDAVAAVRFLIDRPDMTGPVNVVAPEPARNADFSAALGRALRRPVWAPAPAFALKAALGEMSDMILEGQRVLPTRLEQAGFRFRFPDADAALSAIYR
jgi:uncharacterized protein